MGTEQLRGVDEPDAKAVEVQSGHGFVRSLELAVCQAAHTHEKAQMQLQVESLARGAADGATEARASPQPRNDCVGTLVRCCDVSVLMGANAENS